MRFRLAPACALVLSCLAIGACAVDAEHIGSTSSAYTEGQIAATRIWGFGQGTHYLDFAPSTSLFVNRNYAWAKKDSMLVKSGTGNQPPVVFSVTGAEEFRLERQPPPPAPSTTITPPPGPNGYTINLPQIDLTPQVDLSTLLPIRNDEAVAIKIVGKGYLTLLSDGRTALTQTAAYRWRFHGKESGTGSVDGSIENIELQDSVTNEFLVACPWKSSGIMSRTRCGPYSEDPPPPPPPPNDSVNTAANMKLVGGNPPPGGCTVSQPLTFTFTPLQLTGNDGRSSAFTEVYGGAPSTSCIFQEQVFNVRAGTWRVQAAHAGWVATCDITLPSLFHTNFRFNVAGCEQGPGFPGE